MLDHPNDIEYNLKFLFVPPACKSTAIDKPGLSPVLPSQRNPLFALTTARAQTEVISCKPFPNLSDDLVMLIRRLGLDESFISQRLAEQTTASKLLEARQMASATAADAIDGGPRYKPLTREISTQTPTMVCRRCEDRDMLKMIGISTQTRRIEMYGAGCQTSETDMTLAKLKFQSWEREKKAAVKRERADDENDRDPKKLSIAPPGYREKDPAKAAADFYCAPKEKTYGYSYRR